MLRALRRFRRDSRGATALEFSLVAIPFITMMLAVFEFSMIYICAVSLDNATSQAARTLRTGEAAAANLTQTQFRDAICAQMGWLQGSCSSQLYVDVRTLSNFQNPTSVNPVISGTFHPENLSYTQGSACSIMIVRAFYQWPILTYALKILSTVNGGADGTDVVTATTAFRNEPYTPTANSC